MEMTQIGRNLDAIRKQRGFTIDELEQRMGLSHNSTYVHIRTGRMTLGVLLRYAEVLGCNVDELVSGTLDPEGVDLSADITVRWPWNLALAVVKGFNKNPSDEDLDRMWRVYCPGLLEQLETLTVREKDVLLMRYEHGMTLEQCGNKYNVTKERIREIEAKALRKLRHPSRSREFILDTMHKAHEIAEERDKLKLEVITLRERCKVDEPETERPYTDIHIEDLELSVRSYNCLARANMYHLSDFEGKTVEDLKKVRNLGMKSIKEIVLKLREYGVEIKNV